MVDVVQRLRRKTRFARIAVLALVFVVTLIAGGCFGDETIDHLQVTTEETVVIAVDGRGWRVVAPRQNPTWVREGLEVWVTGERLAVTWLNEDDRTHEIMVLGDQGGDGRDITHFRLARGEGHTHELPVGFSSRFHSHHAADLPELSIDVVASSS